jgi:hypothetical protein
MATALLALLLDPHVLVPLLSILSTLAAVLFKLLVKDPAKQEKAKSVLDSGLPVAIQAFKAVAAATPNKIDDAIVAGLDALVAHAESQGLTLTKDHKTAAVAAFKAAVQEAK